MENKKRKSYKDYRISIIVRNLMHENDKIPFVNIEHYL